MPHPHRYPRHRHHVTAAWGLTRTLRRTTLLVCTCLWLSGGMWMVLHYFFEPATEFGATPNPWEPTMMRIHGTLAIVTVYLLGWLSTRHIVEMWRRGSRRASGVLLSIACIVLAASGYALYYLISDSWHHVAAVTHEVIGVSVIGAALIHWYGRKVRRSA